MHFSFEIIYHDIPEHESCVSHEQYLQLMRATFCFVPFSQRVNRPIDEISCCIVHTNNKQIQSLNKEFRKKDKPTNVLSFPLYEFNWKIPESYLIQENSLELGDIVFSLETLQEEATDFTKHYVHLFIHSLLHLLGYDHKTEEDATEMEALEQQILKHYYNYNAPYAH